MAAKEGSSPVSVQQLTEADEKYNKALKLRDTDAESAIQLLGEVLEIRNKAYGEKALECADVYLYYGQLLFEQAQANTDYLGEQMKHAAMERARHIVSADGHDGAGGSDDEAEAADIGADDAELEGAEPDQQPEHAAEADETTPMTDAAAVPKTTQATEGTAQAAADPAEAQAAKPADQDPPTTAAPADQQEAITGRDNGAADAPAAEVPEAATDAGGQQDEQGAEEAGDDNGDDEGEGSDEDVESDADAAEAEEGEEAAQVTGESDDMALAWEMLEMARLIYTNDGAAGHASKLADCYMYVGDILAEQEKFEEAVKEYNTALEMLKKVEGGLSAVKRRAAEVEFKRSTALQLSEQPSEALAAICSAKAHLQARLDELNLQLASKSGGTSSTAADAAGAAAFAAFASVLTSYKPAETAEAKDTAKTAEEAAADAALQQEIADLRSVVDSMDDRIAELKAAVDDHNDMKETIRKAFATISAVKPSTAEKAAADGAGISGAADAAAGPMETIGFGPAPVSAGPVNDMGVIGKGKRVAPMPVASEPAAPADADGSAEVGAVEGVKKRPLSDVYNTDQQPSADKVEVSGSKGDTKVQTTSEQAGTKKVKA